VVGRPHDFSKETNGYSPGLYTMAEGYHMKDENNKMPVKCLVPLAQMVGGDDEDTRLLNAMASGAQSYLRSFRWCKDIREVYFGDGYGGIVALFLFWIQPAHEGVDEWLWIVFGDLPPAYLVTDALKTPSQALEGYMEETLRWVELAKQGKTSEDVIPVNVPATPGNAADLEKRLKFLKEIIVPAFRAAEADQA
jgi:hypothetical protein